MTKHFKYMVCFLGAENLRLNISNILWSVHFGGQRTCILFPSFDKTALNLSGLYLLRKEVHHKTKLDRGAPLKSQKRIMIDENKTTFYQKLTDSSEIFLFTIHLSLVLYSDWLKHCLFGFKHKCMNLHRQKLDLHQDMLMDMFIFT